MTRHHTTRHRLTAIAAATLCLGLALGTATAAIADDDRESDSGVAITVPAAQPRSAIPSTKFTAVHRGSGAAVTGTPAVLKQGDKIEVCWTTGTLTLGDGTLTPFLSTTSPFSFTGAVPAGTTVAANSGTGSGDQCVQWDVPALSAGQYGFALLKDWNGTDGTWIDAPWAFRVNTAVNPGVNPGGGGGTNIRPGGGGGGGGGGTGGGNTTPTPPGPGAPTEPKIPNSPATTGAEAHVDRRDQTYRAGDKITVTADGFTAGEQVQIVLFSDPVLIGNVEAAANGKLSHTFTLADETETGKHTLQLTGWQSKRVAIASFLVVSDAVAGDVVASAFVIPVWVWWVLGVVLAMLAALGIWWIMRIMREQGHGSTYGHSAGGATA